MTTRRWMIAVTVVALLMGGPIEGVRLLRRHRTFRRRADVHEILEEHRRLHGREQFDRTRLADYHAAITRKYRRAARCPWLPVEPDPAAPGP
jgi:hypothetical protein